MTRKSLLFIIIITGLSSLGFCKDPAKVPSKVPFITVWGHAEKGPALFIDYTKLYENNEIINRSMRMGSGSNFQEQQVEYWLIGCIGYYMLKYDSWFVYMSDPYTERTGEQVDQLLAHRRVIDITDDILNNWNRIDAGKYTILKAGRYLYVLPQYVNEWPLHLGNPGY